MKVVLQRGSGQQESVRRLDLTDNDGQFTLLVLDPVRLVDHHVLPGELLEHGLLAKDHLVAGHDNVPAPRHHHVADKRGPGLLVT